MGQGEPDGCGVALSDERRRSILRGVGGDAVGCGRRSVHFRTGASIHVNQSIGLRKDGVANFFWGWNYGIIHSHEKIQDFGDQSWLHLHEGESVRGRDVGLRT